MEKGSSWVMILVMAIFCSGQSSAVKIEDSKGRAIEADIIEADKETVTIKKANGEKTFTLKRNTLSPDSNTLIDGFLEALEEEEAKKNVGKVEVIVKGGADLAKLKLSMKPPVKGVRPFAHESEMTVGVDNGDAEPLWIFIKTKKEANEDLAKLTKEEATGFKVDEASLKEVQCGEWSGYILENQPAYEDGHGFFHNGEFFMHFVYSRKARGPFQEKMIHGLIDSITIDKVK